jgi:transcriptional regulator of acetoin/glycerol metabolism
MVQDWRMESVVQSATKDDVLVKLDEIKRKHVLRVLDACHGHRTEAARRLGIDRKTLGRMLGRWAQRDGEQR